MLDVVDLFKERDTLDELGIGPVRDSFATQISDPSYTTMSPIKLLAAV